MPKDTSSAKRKPPRPSKPLKRPGSRLEGFRSLAEAVNRNEFVMLPRSLTGRDRRAHVRQTIREDHRTRIAQHDSEAAEKFDKLAGSLFSFFRGTALLFYRDMTGEDGWMPTVLVLGDVHPENYGIMPNADNVPIFGVNDFDEACYAPFTWDLKRGATGFMIAAGEIAGFGRKKQRKIAKKFLRGYVDDVRRYAANSTEGHEEARLDNSPALIRRLFEKARCERATWLAEDYLDDYGRGFRKSRKLTPITSRKDEFQDLMGRLIAENDIHPPDRAGELKVKDVAIRHGQGTASLGLPRYYVLIEGPQADGTDDLIIEFKRARQTALDGLVPASDYLMGGEGERIAHAQAVQLVRGDVFYGGLEFEGVSFMSRERAPFRKSMKLKDLAKEEWKSYARICGASLAQAHALSDEVGRLDYDVEPVIVEAISPPELFIEDIVDYADEAAQRARIDHAFFRADHELGAFRHIDFAYR